MCNNNIPNYIKLMHKLNRTNIMEQLIIVLIPYLEEIGVVPKNLLDPEDIGTMIRRNVENYYPNDTASHPRRFAHSATPLRELQISRLGFGC